MIGGTLRHVAQFGSLYRKLLRGKFQVGDDSFQNGPAGGGIEVEFRTSQLLTYPGNIAVGIYQSQVPVRPEP